MRFQFSKKQLTACFGPYGPDFVERVWGEERVFSLGYLQVADLKYSTRVRAASVDLLKCFNACHVFAELGLWIGK